MALLLLRLLLMRLLGGLFLLGLTVMLGTVMMTLLVFVSALLILSFVRLSFLRGGRGRPLRLLFLGGVLNDGRRAFSLGGRLHEVATLARGILFMSAALLLGRFGPFFFFHMRSFLYGAPWGDES